jgi:hypothetical protein
MWKLHHKASYILINESDNVIRVITYITVNLEHAQQQHPLWASMNMLQIQGAPLHLYEYVAHTRCHVISSTFPPINLKNWTEHSDRRLKLHHLANHYGWATKKNRFPRSHILHGIANMGIVEHVFVFLL